MRTAKSRGQWQPQTVWKTPYYQSDCKAVYQAPAPHNTCGSCWLGTAQQFYHDMGGEGGSWLTSKLKQGAHIHQPIAWLLPHTCAQPYHGGSGSHRQLFRPYWGPSAWHSLRSVTGNNSCVKDSFLSSAWEPHCSSPTTSAGKVDHGFGVCVPRALICLLKIVN